MQSPFTEQKIDVDVGPLVEDIARGRAVAYVGAGASIPSGFPSWGELLRECLTEAKYSNSRQSRFSMAENFYNAGDYLHAAELLQRGREKSLETYIRDRFTREATPSPIHEAIARIPFSLLLTSNYDRLLEQRLKTGALTWQDSSAIFAAIKHNSNVVVKTHGDVVKTSTLVLTRTQYGRLLHLSEAFISCLRTLFTFRTVLFVGSSLRDHDVLSVMESAHYAYGEDFGPHFAILFADQVNQDYVDFLWDSYSIRTILCLTGVANPTPDQRTDAAVQVLTELAGLAGLKRYESGRLNNIRDPLFNQWCAAAELIKHAADLTGSLRGEVCYIEDESRQVLGRASSFSAREVGPRHRVKPLPDIDPFSVIGTLFLERKLGSDFIYISDTDKADSQLRDQSFANAKYVECDQGVRSELACPVYADGRRVGVVNVESEFSNAYTPAHLTVLKGMCDQAGWIYHHTRQLRKSCSGMAPFLKDFVAFRRMMLRSRLLAHLDLKFILYEIDYQRGRLIARSELADAKEFNYRFDESSLATRVLKTRLADRVPDAEVEITHPDSRLNRKGVEKFGISGPVAGLPIQVAGATVAIMVIWSGHGKRTDPNLFDAACERARRAATLLANDPLLIGNDDEHTHVAAGLSARFIERLYASLDPIDEGAFWGLRNLKSREFRQRVTTVLLDALLAEECQLQRIRLWQRTRSSDNSDPIVFVCMESITTPGATKLGASARGAYRKVAGLRDDPYCVYTLTRFQHDPYARWQHWSMFGVHDRNCEVLDKDPDGSWIVAPIVKNFRMQTHQWNRQPGVAPNDFPCVLRGFVSADTHAPHDQGSVPFKERIVSASQSRFQLYAVDLVTELLTHVIIHPRPQDEILTAGGLIPTSDLIKRLSAGASAVSV